jgi:hypothetical protein
MVTTVMDRPYVLSHMCTRSITDKLKNWAPRYDTYVEVFKSYLNPGFVLIIINFFVKQTSMLKGTVHLSETFLTHGSRTLPVLTLTLYRPGQFLKCPGDRDCSIARQSVHEGAKVFSPTYQPSLPPHRCSWHSFLLRGWVETRVVVRPVGLREWEIQMTPSGIENVTFGLLRSASTNCATACPKFPPLPMDSESISLSLSGIPYVNKTE